MVRSLLSIGSIGLVLGVVACSGSSAPSLSVEHVDLESPAGPGSGEPFLSTDGDDVYLSWLEAVADDHHELRFSRLEGDAWSEPRTVARSDRFFVNWADFPSLTPGPDGGLWAHWLERGTEGGYDYGVRIVRSADGGESWSEPVTPHEDGTPTEHGFVSTIPSPEGMGFVWLDGRRYAEGPEGGEPTQEMTLRYRSVGPDGEMATETLVDGRVCDCCQTASAMTREGPVTVYRNRTDDEIRDIYAARMQNGEWLEGRPVHDDGWEIAGCPVNGPAVVAEDMLVAVAWFTGAGDVPHVKAAFSHDGGATFGEPVVVDDGDPVGRVDVVLENDETVLVSWLERTGGEEAEIRVRRVSTDGTATGSASLVASASGRASGFPRMVPSAPGELVLAWTDLGGGAPQVKVERLRMGDGP